MRFLGPTRCLWLLAWLLPLPAVDDLPMYSRYEQTAAAAQTYADPLQEVISVEFTSPVKKTYVVPAYWTGGANWRVRFQLEEKGNWSYRWVTKDLSLRKLHGKFRVVAARGEKRGSPRLSADRHHFTDGAGQPWFWLSDTAWNGALKATAEEWEQYLSARAAQRFTAIQFVLTQWRAGRTDEAGKVAFGFVNNQLVIDPTFFDRMDQRIQAINRHGMVAAPVLLWALTSKDKESPGESLTNEQAIRLARYMVARYNADDVIWILGGDGDYRAEKAEKWKQIGQGVFPPSFPRRPVTLHPRGMQDPWPGLAGEPWLDFFMYQSGHGDNPAKWKWQVTEGPAKGWLLQPPRPVVDGEPNYEGHVSYQSKKVVDDYAVRRAAYYALLAAPIAGVTYGAHGVWFWSRKAEVPLDHPGSGVALPWRDCLAYPGAKEMTILRDLFDRMEWWKLRPAQELLAVNEEGEGFARYTVAASDAGRAFALVYTPTNNPVKLSPGAWRIATWIDPTTGKLTEAEAGSTMTPPSAGDWLLWLRR